MTVENWVNPFDNPELVAGYETWHETDGRSADIAERRLIRWLLSGLPQAQRLLEIGVGTGHFARWLASEGYHVTGVDLSAPMIAEASRRGGVYLVRADAEALPSLMILSMGCYSLLHLSFCRILNVRCKKQRVSLDTGSS